MMAEFPRFQRVLSIDLIACMFVAVLAGAHATAAAQGAADLVVAEAANGIVKVAAPAAEVNVTLTVVNTSNKEITGIVAQAAPFSDEIGRAHV